ncbi:MAG: energy-coupling factor transporter transmembrane component T [Bacteriovorax sp.]|nr:energy-coupling factor transporter transmembrane component T [Bacteriovorax sp.]
MNQVKPREYLHSWYLLLVTFFTLFFLLSNRNLFLDLPIVVVTFYFYFKNGLTLSKFKRLFLYAFIFSFGLFFLNILYPSKELKTGEVYQISRFVIYQAVWTKALSSMIRLFLVSFLSMSSGAVIDYTKVVLHLIVHKGLKLFWGYPILLAMNSIALFKEEFERIRINAKLRELPWQDQLSLFFPLLVFAIRHSQRGALSLVTRGLNHQKSFYFSYDLSALDRSRLKLFLLAYLLLVGIAIFFR